jgi:hypothetical protein
MVETVNLSQDGSRATITGRKRAPLRKKMNPVWWFMNSSEQTVDEAPWYRPALPYWQRRPYWSIRNPLQNLRAFVLGVSDKNYSIIGRAPVMCVQRNDLLPPKTGFQWCMLYAGDLRLPRFFVSYSGERVVWYFGYHRAGSSGASSTFSVPPEHAHRWGKPTGVGRVIAATSCPKPIRVRSVRYGYAEAQL